MRGIQKFFLPAIAIGGGLFSVTAGLYGIASGRTSLEGIVAIALLLAFSASLAAALGIQGIKYRRLARYAVALPDILRLTEYIRDLSPETMTGAQATVTCDRVLEGLAKVFSLITGARCRAGIEILTPTREGLVQPSRPASDYVVVNLSRDSSTGRFNREDRRRHSVEGNPQYREVFENPACGAYSFRPDAASDPAFLTTETSRDGTPGARGLIGRRSWPLSYRSTLVVKVCHADRCRIDNEHVPIAFLWLRSAEPNALDARHDIELVQRMSHAIAPLVTRCALATKPTHDFRRRSTAAGEMTGPSPG